MGWFKRTPKKTIFQRVMENRKNAPERIAKFLIAQIDAKIEESMSKGYEAAFIYPYRYDLAVDETVLDMVVSHYKAQGFTDVEYNKKSNIEDNRYKTLWVRWWDSEG